MVTSFKNPFCFYVQESLPTYIDLKQKIQNYYSRKSLVSIKNPQVDQICAAKYSKDKAWYRAIIKNINYDQHSILVFLVDYGIDDDIVINEKDINICELFEEFKEHPIMGLKCSLKGIESIQRNNLNYESLSIPDTVLVNFLGHSQDHYYVDVNFEQKNENGDLNSINLNNYLIQNGYVDSTRTNKLKHDVSTKTNGKNGFCFTIKRVLMETLL